MRQPEELGTFNLKLSACKDWHRRSSNIVTEDVHMVPSSFTRVVYHRDDTCVSSELLIEVAS